MSGRTRPQLPRVGHVRTHEPTSKLHRKLDAGRARVLSMTVDRDGDRWFCAVCCEVQREDRAATDAGPVGVDVGVRHLAVKGRRPVKRSERMRRTERRVRRLQARASNVRRDAMHKLTSRFAAEHQVIVVAFYPSSKTCSACGAAKAKLLLSERTFRCQECGLVLDRDENAARNLAALAHTTVAGSGPETLNARSRPQGVPRTRVRPAPAGSGSAANPAAPSGHQTGTAPEQSEAA